MQCCIHPSAHRDGVADDDIRHAMEFAQITLDYESGDRILYLGPDTAANLLEVVTVVETGSGELVIHAMLMQKKYQPLLRGLRERT